MLLEYETRSHAHTVAYPPLNFELYSVHALQEIIIGKPSRMQYPSQLVKNISYFFYLVSKIYSYSYGIYT